MTSSLALTSIPHRPPFRFVDEIGEIDDKRIVTRWFADPDEPFFRGHYPGQPVVPGVILCEACFQAGALLMAHCLGAFDASERVPVLARIQDARFKHIIRPGESVSVEVTLNDVLDEAYYFTGRVHCADRLILRVTFVCMSTPSGGE